MFFLGFLLPPSRLPMIINPISITSKLSSAPFYFFFVNLFHSSPPPLTRKPTTPFNNSQITLNGRRGDLRQAQSIFDSMPSCDRDVVSWTALLSAYAHNGHVPTARQLFDRMPHKNTASWNAMISAYVRASDVSEAFRLFASTPNKNLVSYSAMITGFARAGMMNEAEAVYATMPDIWRDPVGSNALIHGYFKQGDLEAAVRMFGSMKARDVITWTSMVDGYCKYGKLSDAFDLFKVMPKRNVVTWTAMVRGLLKGGNWSGGFGMFLNMRREGVDVNSTTLSVVIDACAELGSVQFGVQIHGLVLRMGFEQNLFVGNYIILMYSRAGCIASARMWFDAMSSKDVVSWNSIINAYVEHDQVEQAFSLFEAMPEKDLVSWTSMLVGFSRRGWTKESIRIFEAMPHKDDVAWTAMITGFAGNGENASAFQYFCRMVREEVEPSPMALCSVLSALAGLAVLDQGTQVHAFVIKLLLESDVSIQTSLITMYAKCGDLGDAYRIFSCISLTNLVAVNSMISAYGQHGLAKEALELFGRIEADGYAKPNKVTFLGVLSACSRSGLVKEGYQYFKSMTSCYGIEPGLEHYTCMVDLLGRAGLLKEAKGFIDSMPVQPNSETWGALLNASRIHSDLSLARLAAERLFELEPKNATAYAVLSNMYSVAGMKEAEEEVRRVKRSTGLKKNPGCSWIAFGNCAVCWNRTSSEAKSKRLVAVHEAMQKD